MFRHEILRMAAMRLFTCALAVCACACVTTDVAGAQTTAKVFKSLGSVQCSRGGADPASLARQLTDAGVAVRNSACGSDGRMRAAMCGANDGRIAIFEVDSADLAAAARLGFAPLANLPEAQVSPCR